MTSSASSRPKLPLLEEPSSFFWTSGADYTLRIQRCDACHRWQHPPLVLCASCHSGQLTPRPVSGKGRVATFTVNVQPWEREAQPFVFAAIELDEQAELYVFSKVLAPPDQVRSGQSVNVTFEQHEDVWLPLFVPAKDAA